MLLQHLQDLFRRIPDNNRAAADEADRCATRLRKHELYLVRVHQHKLAAMALQQF
jgi:hypothetical protein